ncbi:hypothetical protein RI129_000319 [Pyrocoelia pectoralis]|uniref:Golgin-45 n=1 Tax=Pyrocoelia pectoralis TaxID=417401 RepID=A0AAN7VJZ9_9COLE
MYQNMADSALSLKIKNINLDTILRSLQPVIPKPPLIMTVPKYIPQERKPSTFRIGKPKEPKFVPYEPCKATVDRIIPRRKIIKREVLKSSKNNVDIFELVTQIAEVRVTELSKAKLEASEDDRPLISKREWETERKSYETDIKNLRETNAHLENQVKFQTQVNGELKTLLVAAVGEDLESRVQHLTEDKLQLARALLNSANHLTSHQEQTEWLSGQCEVWRSKFLASSLMVEELAHWKTALSDKVNELQENLRNLLYERNRVRKDLLKSSRCLIAATDGNNFNLKSTNIIDLAEMNSKLSENMLNNRNDNKKETIIDETNLEKHTAGEKDALKNLQNPITKVNKPDLLCNALVGAAMSVGGGQMYLQHPTICTTCFNCKGEVEDV